MKRLKINESELRSVIREVLKEQLLQEVRNKVDYFDEWAKLMNCTDPDQFFFVQVIKRYKDNKGMSKAGNYHGGGEFGEYSKGTAFKVKTAQDLMNLKPKIVQYCDDNNARAYITSNPRSESAINAFIPTYQKRSKDPNDPRAVHAAEILAGQAKHDPVNFPDRKRCMLDIDTKDKRVWRITKAIINSYGPDIIEREFTSPSGGLHIMIKDGYMNYIPEMVKDLMVFDAENDKRGNRNFFPDKGFFQTVHFNPDGKFILYSNVDTSGY
jgi:hypothetical protein